MRFRFRSTFHRFDVQENHWSEIILHSHLGKSVLILFITLIYYRSYMNTGQEFSRL